jgi:NIPSNAP
VYRHRFYMQIRYGHFKENLEVWERLNELARARGWPESTFWTPAVGTANEFIIETDYPDLATFQQQGEAFSSDAEVMSVFRTTAEHVVEGSGRDELYQTAPQLA